MNIIQLEAEGLCIIEPRIFKDDRGFFYESFNAKVLARELPGNFAFCQDNFSQSSKNTIRGLHYQRAPYTQTKLVTCLSGEIVDIVVDLRRNSKTYGQHWKVTLNDENRYQLLVPKGFAHGFVVMSDIAMVQYKVDEYYQPRSDSGININSDLGIEWPIDLKDAIISEKDSTLTTFLGQKL